VEAEVLATDERTNRLDFASWRWIFLLSQRGQKLFQFLFGGQVRSKDSDVLAIAAQ